MLSFLWVSKEIKMWANNDPPSLPNNPYPDEATSVFSQPSLPSIPSLPPLSHRSLFDVHHQCAATLICQNSYISSLVLAGDFLFTGSSNREIHLWNRITLNSTPNYGMLVHDCMVVAGKGAVKALIVSSDKLISAHQDHKIRVWKTDNIDSQNQKFTQLATLPTLSDRAFTSLVPKNHIQIRRHKKCTWVHHVDTVSALALSSDGSLLYSVSWDRTLKVWRTTDFKCLESVTNAHEDAINTIALSNDNYIYTGSSDRKIKVWKLNPGEKKHTLIDTLEKHNSGVNALTLRTDGLVLYSGACDRSIVVWMKAGCGGSMSAVGALRGHTKPILCLAIVSDLVCSGSADNTVRIWRGVGRSYSCLAVLEGHNGPVKCITGAFATNSTQSDTTTSTYVLYSASLNCDIKVWQIFVPTVISNDEVYM